jgi:hypothetical protein
MFINMYIKSCKLECLYKIMMHVICTCRSIISLVHVICTCRSIISLVHVICTCRSIISLIRPEPSSFTWLFIQFVFNQVRFLRKIYSIHCCIESYIFMLNSNLKIKIQYFEHCSLTHISTTVKSRTLQTGTFLRNSMKTLHTNKIQK